MSLQIIIVLILTIIIYIISTLAYSVRIVAVKTGRVAVAFAVFNVFALISRTANSIQTPLLSKKIESSISNGNPESLLFMFRWILAATTLATIIGALLMPTFIKVFKKLVESFSIHRSIPRLIMHGFSKAGVEQFKNNLTQPKRSNIAQLKNFKGLPKKIIILNTLASSISIVGGMSALYASCLFPDLRMTGSALSPIINGIATVTMFIFIDPYISMLTDDVLRGECDELQFNRVIIFIVMGQILGTVLAQLFLVPAAQVIVFIAKLI